MCFSKKLLDECINLDKRNRPEVVTDQRAVLLSARCSFAGSWMFRALGFAEMIVVGAPVSVRERAQVFQI
jgi:hypothetical protein